MKSLRSYLVSCADAFSQMADYAVADRVLTQVFTDHPRNDLLEPVLLKVSLLNALYRTQIYDVYGMAAHVLLQGLDDRLGKGDLGAITLIRRGHGVKTRKSEDRDFYSFATKYCHWHRPDVYPMYDYYVTVALRWLNEKIEFCPVFSAGKLRDYRRFVTIVDACRESLRLKWAGYKRLDQGLWILGQVLKEVADKSVLRILGAPPSGV